jgi:hypothetical protein
MDILANIDENEFHFHYDELIESISQPPDGRGK